jgi:hypothetical protein
LAGHLRSFAELPVSSIHTIEDYPPTSGKRKCASPNDLITSTELNVNDVLLGRGVAMNKFIGNKNYRKLTTARKEEYASIPGHGRTKAKIAKEIFNSIRWLGGRVLKLVETEERAENIWKDGAWYEVRNQLPLTGSCKHSEKFMRALATELVVVDNTDQPAAPKREVNCKQSNSGCECSAGSTVCTATHSCDMKGDCLCNREIKH